MSTTPAPAGARPSVDLTSGLSSEAAAAQLARVGPNRLTEPPRRPRWRRFVDQLRSVLVAVLAGAAAVAAALGDLKDAVVVAIVLLINAVLGYVQEGRAEDAMSALRRMLVTRSKVRRDGQVVEVDAEQLVPGDVVLLDVMTGDRVPADGTIVTAVSLAVDESSLTGESVPVEKVATDPDLSTTEDAPQDSRTRAAMNTTVVRGRAEVLVTGTGMHTEMGRVAALMQEAEPESTPLQEQLDSLGRRLTVIAGLAVAVVFATRLAQGEPLADALLGAVALAIAAIPEGLPAVVTVTLAVGVHQMALRKAIVKRLASVETLGSTTVICSDKTGTLTLNQMTARAVSRAGRRLDLGAELPPQERAELATVLEHVVLCSEASFAGHEVVGDPTEGALLRLAVDEGMVIDDVRRATPRIAEIPFDSAAKHMATFHHEGDEVVCLVKGAPDVLVARAAVDQTDAAAWSGANEALASEGMRVIAVASRRVPAALALDERGEVEDPERWVAELDLEALVGIVDPPRPEAAHAIELCRQAGVGVKMITGDHATTASAIAAELGIVGRAVTGAELHAMDDEQLAAEIEQIGVCARVSPEHKVRVVRALKANGHVVAMTGDGVNDAAALRHADIGVAMGITGTEVTKEAADMVLADDDFATIVGAVERGRAIYDNIVKFVRFQLTTNLGAIGTLLGASVLGLPAPLSAIQVLFVNIIADGPPAMTLGVDPPAPDTMQHPPRTPGSPILDRCRILRLLPPALTMVVGTLGVLVLADQRWGEAVALSMAFTTFVLFQLVNVFNARTEHRSVLSRESLSNRKLWIAIGSIAALQVAIVTWGPLRSIFDTTALGVGQWLVCGTLASSVLVVEEVRKALGRRHDRGQTGGGHG